MVPISQKVRTVVEGLSREADWVFTSRPSQKYPRGDAQVSERRLLQYLKRVLGRLGLRGHLHTFRHSFISAALSGGIPEAVVRDWVGHVDDRIIRLYTHIADKTSKAAMKKLAGIMGDTASSADGGTGSSGDRGACEGGGESAQFQHNPEDAQDDASAK